MIIYLLPLVFSSMFILSFASLKVISRYHVKSSSPCIDQNVRNAFILQHGWEFTDLSTVRSVVLFLIFVPTGR